MPEEKAKMLRFVLEQVYEVLKTAVDPTWSNIAMQRLKAVIEENKTVEEAKQIK